MKFLTCAIFFVLAVQGLTDAKHGKDNKKIERDIAETIEHLLEIIREQIEKVIQGVKDAIQDVINKIQEVVPGLIQQVKDKVKEEIEKLKNTIQKIIDEAIAAGKNVEDCVAASEDAVAKLQQKLVEESQACVQDQANQAASIVADAQSKISAITQKVGDLIQEITNCDNLKCIVSSVSKVTELVKEVQEDVSIISQEVGGLLQSIKDQSAVCLAKVSQEVAAEGQQIAQNIQTCIANK